MTPNERPLLDDLLQRLAHAGPATKDSEADSRIHQALAAQPMPSATSSTARSASRTTRSSLAAQMVRSSTERIGRCAVHAASGDPS